MERVLILPDIHGREFWKGAIQKYPKDQYPDLEIVFLGDYLDPYTGYEDITKEQAYNNFLEILDLAKNDNRVQLLIGNHDWHYFVNLDTCRIDYSREAQIATLFKDNIHLFRLIKTIEINNQKYLFSHAGITSEWLYSISQMAYNRWSQPQIDKYLSDNENAIIFLDELRHIDQTYNFNIFEQCLINYNNPFFTYIISMISHERGGQYSYGSLIWADVHEHIYSHKPIPNYYQIFGHTISYPYSQHSYEINDNWAMLDASQPFILYDNGDIKII